MDTLQNGRFLTLKHWKGIHFSIFCHRQTLWTVAKIIMSNQHHTPWTPTASYTTDASSWPWVHLHALSRRRGNWIPVYRFKPQGQIALNYRQHSTLHHACPYRHLQKSCLHCKNHPMLWPYQHKTFS